MEAPLTPLTRFLLWDYDRLSLPYLVLCFGLFALILSIPPAWVGDPMALLP